MNAPELKKILCDRLRQQAGLDEHRPYLGMSSIAECSQKQYDRFVSGRSELIDQMYWYCWTGYMHEARIISLLPAHSMDIESAQTEVVAGFDARFRGHVDYLLGDDLVEIKSVSWEKFNKIINKGWPAFNHMAQVQMYMRHGGWRKAFIVYVCRDVPHKEFNGLPLWVFEVKPNENLAGQLDRKAKVILASIDAGQRPECDCGWC